MSGKFFSKFDSEYFSLFIFLKYLLLLLLIMIYVPKMTLLEKSKICRTFRAVGHLGTIQTSKTARITRLPGGHEVDMYNYISVNVSLPGKCYLHGCRVIWPLSTRLPGTYLPGACFTNDLSKDFRLKL